jgi:hypothetical protein
VPSRLGGLLSDYRKIPQPRDVNLEGHSFELHRAVALGELNLL